MKVRVDEIHIGERIRKDIGDLESLKNSLSKHGLISPVVINLDGELIAGYRRLTAAKELGWVEIEVNVVHAESQEDLLDIELEENMIRKDFTKDEYEYGTSLQEKLLKKNPFVRFFKWILSLFKKKK